MRVRVRACAYMLVCMCHSCFSYRCSIMLKFCACCTTPSVHVCTHAGCYREVKHLLILAMSIARSKLVQQGGGAPPPLWPGPGCRGPWTGPHGPKPFIEIQGAGWPSGHRAGHPGGGGFTTNEAPATAGSVPLPTTTTFSRSGSVS